MPDGVGTLTEEDPGFTTLSTLRQQELEALQPGFGGITGSPLLSDTSPDFDPEPPKETDNPFANFTLDQLREFQASRQRVGRFIPQRQDPTPGMVSALTRGVSAGISNMAATATGVLAVASETLFDSPRMRDSFVRSMQASLENAAKIGKPFQIESMSEASPAELGRFLAFGLGQTAPFMVESVVAALTGGVVGLAGRAAVRRVAQKIIQKKALSKLDKRVLANSFKLLAENGSTLISPKTGAVTGFALESLYQGIGEGFKQTGSVDEALRVAVPFAATEFISAAVPTAALMTRAGGAGRGIIRGMATRAPIAGAAGAVTEAATERLQENILQAAQARVDPTFDPDSPEAREARNQATVLGGVAGLVLGTGAGTIGGIRAGAQRRDPGTFQPMQEGAPGEAPTEPQITSRLRELEPQFIIPPREVPPTLQPGGALTVDLLRRFGRPEEVRKKKFTDVDRFRSMRRDMPILTKAENQANLAFREQQGASMEEIAERSTRPTLDTLDTAIDRIQAEMEADGRAIFDEDIEAERRAILRDIAPVKRPKRVSQIQQQRDAIRDIRKRLAFLQKRRPPKIPKLVTQQDIDAEAERIRQDLEALKPEPPAPPTATQLEAETRRITTPETPVTIPQLETAITQLEKEVPAKPVKKPPAAPKVDLEAERQKTLKAIAAKKGPTEVTTPEQLRVEADKTVDNKTLTPAQKEAGNYPKGKPKIGPILTTVETRKGDVRSGTDAQGKPWAVKIKNDYGYINKAFSKEKNVKGERDNMDVILGKNAPDTSLPIFVVDQITPDGKFDEHKVVMGAKDFNEAREIFAGNWTSKALAERHIGKITEFSLPQFKEWAFDKQKTLKPAGQAAEGTFQRRQPDDRAQAFDPPPQTEQQARQINDQVKSTPLSEDQDLQNLSQEILQFIEGEKTKTANVKKQC